MGRRQPLPHKQKVNPVQPNTRERWDLFNVGVGAYTLPLNVERLFEDATRLGRDPIHSELAPDVFLEADSLRESAHRLAPNARVAEQYDVALDRVLAGPPPTARGTEQRVREGLGRATAAVVGHCNLRLPWFALGTAADTYALLYQGRVIRRYAARAHGVIAVLNLFAAQEWAEVVQLPQRLVSNLHDLVKSLNNDLGEIRFRADGTGRGITWAPVT